MDYTRWIEPWSEAFRAQRDVGLRVPINFHTQAAVSLTQACFANNQYEHDAFKKCFSNLLAVGFPQFIVDTYWDPLRSVWSLCPVELPQSNGGGSNPGSVPVATGPTVVPSSDTVQAQIPQSTLKIPPFAKRQETPTSATVGSISAATSVVSSTPSSTSSTSSSAATPTIIDYPNANGPPILQVGSYNCTSLVTLVLLTGILEDFLETTSTTTGASITMFTFNVHAAASLGHPDAPAPDLSPNQLPVSGQLLSDVLRGNLSDKAFTPSLLSNQRANLGNSWFDVSWNNRPLDGYYETLKNNQNHQYTNSGWPTEAFMEFKQFYRVVTSYGTVDPQMSKYNIGPDLDYIFPPGTIIDEAETSLTTDGRITSGCLFAANEDTITPTTNSSFALTAAPPLFITANPNLTSPIPSITNLTACGITSLLNQTLANTTADKNPLPYAAYVHSTLWSFAPGQPLNASASNPDPNDNRCVVMMKSPYPSRWRVTNCGEAHRVACHDPRKPYNWLISSAATPYANAASFCASPAEFSVPHTPLENAHLFAAFEKVAPSGDDAVYINLNSLGVRDCWVVGLNGTCPYLPSTDTNRTRIVVVPTVAAVLIFLLAVMTFFVKCAANRRENRRGRKRRLVDGWEYEGVPS
ncbi:lectin c-type domain [Pyrenophora seminiperda CCB06]|uniref:Maintenance of telomere capping protein 6 n=1 Tax=Pyrenophora seminiperda CCB06 TaxID=1302712 RepID=A0A3M7MBX9_9PLEO|nr:lectin c-type domain [Pyrenophora seminiperda CCB06]